MSGQGAVPDVHALGDAGGVVYAASPQTGVRASTDGGSSWQVRNGQDERSLMGTLLVDSRDPARLIAADMSTGPYHKR